MPVHFAAARSTAHSPIARALAKKALARAANDNGDESGFSLASFDSTMRAALRHFAEHGMGAAEAARQQAEQAFLNGDRQSGAWWLEVCRTLDRRLAERFEQSLKPAVALIS